MDDICPSCREPLDYPSGDGCAAMTKHNDKTFNSEDPLSNLTLDTDELGIWLVDETPEGPQQLGHVPWKDITRGVKRALLEEVKFIAIAPDTKGCISKQRYVLVLERDMDTTMTDEVGQMKVTGITEHEDGGATIEFDVDDTTAALAQELGLKLMIFCGATGTNLDYVFDSILGKELDNE